MPKAKGLIVAALVALVVMVAINKFDAFKSLRPKTLAS